jgi:trigger factor
VRLKPVLRFRDAELDGFDSLMDGVNAGDVRETELIVSMEAEPLEMRGEAVQARFSVHDVKRLRQPELTREFLQRLGVDDEEELHLEIRKTLERQVTYQQRQSTRQQVLEKITESANWDLPEELVRKQVENALYREVLEMQQAGFTTQEIRARENELRQQSVTSTRLAMKQHFVLDKIATDEDIQVMPTDISTEIALMAMQRGESPRRLRARLKKSGVMENLEAQIRERKAVDFILEHAQFTDVEMNRPVDNRVEALNQSICSTIADTDASTAAQEDEEDEPEG